MHLLARDGQQRAQRLAVRVGTLLVPAMVLSVVLVSRAGVATAASKTPINASNYELTCSGQKGTVQFSPPLVQGGTAHFDALKVKATLTGCHAIAPAGAAPLTVRKGTVTGTLTGSRGNSCSLLLASLANGGNLPFSGKLTIKWSTVPKLTSGNTVVVAPSGLLGFNGADNTLIFPGSTHGTVSGSFSANSSRSFSYSVAQSGLTAVSEGCEGKGVKKLTTQAGIVNLGASPSAVTVSPHNPGITPGDATAQEPFEAYGTYLGQRINVSLLASWSSSDTSVATVGVPQALCSLPGSAVGTCTEATTTEADETTPGNSIISASLGGVTGSSLLQSVLPVQITTSSPLPDAHVGVPYSFTLTAANGLAPYRWSSPDTASVGLTLDPATGVISGTPTEAASGSFEVSVTDSSAFSPGALATLSLTIDP